MGEGTKVGLLNHVFRLGVIIEDAAGHTVEAPIMPLHDELDCRFVPASGAFHQPFITECLQ
jgi:hypothetical protein